MSEPSKKSPSLPPRWFIRSFWAVQRAVAEPAWWLNLQAHPDVTVDLPGESRAVHAHAADKDERPRLWAWLSTYDKDLDAFAARRSRETAVVILSPRPE
jgi:hypothetical protein